MGVSFAKLKSNDKLTWVKDAIGVSSFVNEVKGYVELFYVSYIVDMCCIGVQVISFTIWVFEKLKSHDNQTWVKDAVGVPSSSCVNELKDHVELFLCELP